MKLLHKILILVFVTSMLFTSVGCSSYKIPDEFMVDSNDCTLPQEFERGWYKFMSKNVATIKFLTPELRRSTAEYYETVKDTVFKITDDEFVFGDNSVETPRYYEIQFDGIIRTYAGKADWYRSIQSSELSEIDADESNHEITRCFVVADKNGVDSFFRIYLIDDEIWVAHFYTREETLVCETIFIITYDNLKNKMDF